MSTKPFAILSVVTALHNDEDIVECFVGEVCDFLRGRADETELILVDDGSSDATAAKVKQLLTHRRGLRLIRLSRPLGYDIAVSAGLDSALGDFVCVLRAGHDPVSALPEMLAAACDGPRVVVGMPCEKSGLGLVGRLILAVSRRLTRLLLGLTTAGYDATMIVLPRAAVLAITRERTKIRHLVGVVRSVGFPPKLIAYMRRDAPPGARKPTLRAAVRQLLNYAVASEAHPLRLVSRLALLAAGLNLLYAGYVVAVHVFKSHVAEGWTTLSLQLAGMFFLVFCVLVLMAEYLGYILAESRDRPLYHVLEEAASAVPPPSTPNVVSEAVAGQDDPGHP